jgi:nucleotide-binding universal stress UspA family protein
MKNILVTLELDESSQKIVDYAGGLAKKLDAKLWLVHITAPEPDFVGYKVGPQYVRDARADEIKGELAELRKHTYSLKEKGIDAEGFLLQGATVDMVAEESEKLNIDLLIAGRHDKDFFYRLFAGSVSEEILRRVRIPVLLLPI